MEQNHPIPQQISSYQFRLVGDMTLKQFFQLAGGLLVSLLFYASPLPPLIKWPLIIFFAILGAALAFLPFEERPLEQWVFAFFRSIYSPTLYYWKRQDKPPVYFQDESTAPSPTEEKIIAPQGEAALNEYLQKSPIQKEGLLSKFEEAEKSFLLAVGQNIVSTPTPATTPMVNQYQVRPRVVVEEKRPTDVVLAPVSSAFGSGPSKEPAQSAQFSLDAAPPSPPIQPNTITGQVIDTDGKIISGAILEIKDVGGRPVRACRSNKLGHFIIVTPLQNGVYQITTEVEGHEFNPVSFEAKGEIIPPIAIRAKGAKPKLQ